MRLLLGALAFFAVKAFLGLASAMRYAKCGKEWAIVFAMVVMLSGLTGLAYLWRAMR